MIWDIFERVFGPQWPPSILKRGGLLSDSPQLYATNKDEWGVNEWRLYAEILEERGGHLRDQVVNLKKQLDKAQLGLYLAKQRASRKKSETQTNAITPTIGALSIPTVIHKQKGRPKGSNYEDIAKEALKIKEAHGNQITDKEAAIEAQCNLGASVWKARQSAKSITQQMTILRKRNGTQLRRRTTPKN